MEKRKKFLSAKLFASAMIFFCISVILLGAYYVHTVNRVYTDEIYMSQKNSLYNADEYVSSVAMEISDAVDSLSEYEQVFDGFVSAYDYNRYLYSLDLTKIINTVAAEHSNIVGIEALINCGGDIKVISAGDYNTEYIKKYMTVDAWPKDYELMVIPSEKIGNILAVKRPDMDTNILVMVEITPFFFGTAENGGNTVITDCNGEIAYRRHAIQNDRLVTLISDIVKSNSSSGINDHIAGTTVAYSKSEFDGLYIFNVQNAENLDDNLKRIFSMLVLIIIITFLVSLIIAWILSRVITRRITTLNSFIKNNDYKNSSDYEITGKCFKKPGIKHQVILYHCISCGVPLILAVAVMLANTIGAVGDGAKRVFEKNTYQVRESVNLYFDKYVKKAKVLALNPQTVGIIKNPNSEYMPHGDKINIYSSDGKVIYSSEKIMNPTIENIGEGIFSDKRNISFIVKVEEDAVSDRNYSNNVIGYVELTVNKNELRSIAGAEPGMEGSDICIADNSGKVMLSNRRQLEETTIDITSHGNNGHSLPLNGGYVITAMNSTNQDSGIYRLILEALLIIVLFMCALIIYTYLYSSRFCRPIHNITKSFRNAAKGDFAEVSVKTGDEIEELAHSYNDMLHQIQELIRERCELWERQRELDYRSREAELNVLQSQINPHFIYNTLESVKWIVLSGEPEKAADMITLLAEMFRYCIEKSESEISLKDELASLSSYIEIQLIRFEDSLEITQHTEVDTSKYKVPKMILQPLIENAVSHGVEPNDECGKIDISIYEEENALIIKITDNGVGISPGQLEKIRAVANSGGGHRKDGIGMGMANVNRRIKLMYGEGFGLEINSVQHKGTTVTLKIPSGGKYV